MIREVLKNVKDLPLVKDCEGNLPIMTAIESNNVLLCQELLTTSLDEQVKSMKVLFQMAFHVIWNDNASQLAVVGKV